MAARENQGYLIAVIVLVLLALILALVAFLGIQKAYEQAELAQASDAKHKATLLLAKAEGLKAEALKAIIGDLGTAPSELGKTSTTSSRKSELHKRSTGSKLKHRSPATRMQLWRHFAVVSLT